MRVDAQLVRERLVGTLLAEAERLNRDSAQPVSLAEALGTVTDDGDREDPTESAVLIAAATARMGYRCRQAEREMFEPARAPMPWLKQELASREAIEVAAELARSEPDDRPDPGESPSWRVTGPGGHVRHYAALDTISQLVADAGMPGELPAGVTLSDLKRCWMLGFFLRCCEDALD